MVLGYIGLSRGGGSVTQFTVREHRRHRCGEGDRGGFTGKGERRWWGHPYFQPINYFPFFLIKKTSHLRWKCHHQIGV
ncbi:hypothetical protein HanRHA438_Chr09g0374961 [Helianthus annuus]|nr:hypothetical protein HanRHA438_Chr09g0374961 [Helianthus annuus]